MVVEEKVYVGYSDINKEMALSNTSMLKFFENTACIHGALAGESIKTSPIRWFLTAYHVRVHKRPEIEDRIRVRTWSREMRGASACREFEICSEQGEVCVTALSNWARTNALTKHIERADPEAVARYGSEREHRNFEKPWISKIAAPQEYIREKDFTVERNFIDVNDHMNNVFYLDLAELVLPDEVYAKDESCEFEIEYRQAIKYGETVKCCYSETDEANFVTVKDDNGDIRAIIKLYKTYDA